MVDVDHELELARLHRERQHDEPERETTRPDGDDDNWLVSCALSLVTWSLQVLDPRVDSGVVDSRPASSC